MILALLALACAGDPVDRLPERTVRLVPVLEGVPQITEVVPIPGHAAVAVANKAGQVFRVDLPGGTKTKWFDVPVRGSSELGLLGLAFAPDFATTGHLYVSATPSDGDRRSQIARWKVDPATLGHPQRVGTVLELAQPYANHNGGSLRFGPDGMLYAGFGDGGSANDPLGSGQDRSTWLGAILRLDVTELPYRVPPDNPFVGQAGQRPEIWAWGLRNPWKFELLPDGRAIIGDVGQNEVEEVTIGGAGANHGWNVFEGDRCFRGPCEATQGTVKPVFTYTHAVGQSITGGVVPTAGPFAGTYVFGDFVSGRLWSLDLGTAQAVGLGDHGIMPSVFALDPTGQLLVADYQGGVLYRVEAP